MVSHDPLSEREREILRLVANGATNQAIAHELSISINTVKVHVRNIFGKIDAGSRAEAALYAARIGLVRSGDLRPATLGRDDDAGERTGSPVDGPAAVLSAEAPAGRPPIGLPMPRAWVLLLIPVIFIAVIVGQLLQSPLGGPVPTPTSAPNPVQRWRELTAMPAGKLGFAAATVTLEGKSFVYVIGGETGGQATSTVLRYEPTADVWVPLTDKPTAVTNVRAAVVGNRIFVAGGKTASGQPTTVLEAYDPQRDRWTALASMPAPREGHAVTAVEGKLYVIGGWDGTRIRSDVWQYNPDDNTWRARTSMPTARAFAAATVIDGRVYVVAGEGEAGPLTVNERYSPAAEDGAEAPWTTKAPLPGAARRPDAAAISGLAMMVGMDSSPGQLAVYNPQTDSWRTSAIPLTNLREIRVVPVGTKLYLTGGRREEGESAGIFEYQVVSTVFLPVVP